MRQCPVCSWPLSVEWFDDARQAIIVDGKARPLSASMWKLLSFFRVYPGQVIPTRQVHSKMYGGYDVAPPLNRLRVDIHTLRKLLRDTPYTIIGRKGSGYLFDRAHEE